MSGNVESMLDKLRAVADLLEHTELTAAQTRVTVAAALRELVVMFTVLQLEGKL